MLVLAPLPVPAQQAPARVTPDLAGLSRGLETVAAQVAPTVVEIRVTAYGPLDGGAVGAASLPHAFTISW